ncbi:sigma-70 family RNA polymerase sigma factor [Leifsonia sp. C5G2]|uniref:RNA polymerase sigma factor n=1 Tax=Leifsonia sp. C5G2 TaxID=2735269 RepID=UPI001584EBDA|nr:sigma-70 family RNA polymerase sigma factor [Leifsonia sp. C5G2]NUU06853.1 sigma-70 family RNA polymerase sigma factor [Leifsonia sp. C5G2]
MTVDAARPTDLQLLDRVRGGDPAALGELWSRYQGWAHHVARCTTSRFDADDIVQEAFAKVLTSLRNGNGPTEGFAHYLRTAIRNVAATWGARAARATLVPLPDDSALGSYRFEVSDLGDLERPFRSLPERWQHVLVLTVLQQLPLETVSRLLGVSLGGATALAARARAGLRAALATHGEELALAA